VLAANLAATLARTRAEVVLVCADPHGTVTPELLGVSDGRGLAEVLGGSATAVEVARRPPDERRLRVITPGFDTSGVLLHLQYETSRRLLSELTRDARYVIVEVQSLGEDSDAFALAEFADAAIMSIETSLTTRPGAADCLQRLDRLRTSVLGAVVLPAADKRSAARLTAAPAASARSAGPQAASAPKPPKPASLLPRSAVARVARAARRARAVRIMRAGRPTRTGGARPTRPAAGAARVAAGPYPPLGPRRGPPRPTRRR